MSRVRTVVATELLLLLGLAGFVGAAYLVERTGGLDDPIHLSPLSAIALSALPALLWLGYFYAQDRHEPEPKHYVFGVFLLGVFIAGPVADFVIGQVMPTRTAAPPSFAPLGAERLVFGFLLLGLSQEIAKYAVVRYSVYLSPEFDEPMDGVIYMTAVGIGFATYENYHFLQGHRGEVFLSTGIATVVVKALAHACFAGVLGYALGRAKFSTTSPVVRSVTLLAGLLGAAALNGVFVLVKDVVAVAHLEVTPWRVVAFAFGFAAVVFILLSLLMQRLLSISPHRSSE